MFYDLLAELGSLRALNAAQVSGAGGGNHPRHLYELLPVAALIGTLFALAQLASNSEYGVMRTSGVSVLQVAMVLFGVSLVVAGAVFVIGEYVVPRAEQLVLRVRAFAGARPYVARAFESGFWFKDGNTFIHIGSGLPDGWLRKVRVFEYRDATHLGRTMTAEAATFLGGQQCAVLAWCDRATEIGLSAVALAEIVSAFCRLRRENRITDAQYRQLKSLLQLDIEDAAICDLDAGSHGADDFGT